MSCALDLAASELGLYYCGTARTGLFSLHHRGQDVAVSPADDSPVLLTPWAHTSVRHAPRTRFCALGIAPAFLETLRQ